MGRSLPAGTPGKVLLTGGLGFIGHHLADRLLEEGAQVTIVDDRRSAAVPPAWFEGRATVHAAAVAGFRVEEQYDWVCHLAGPVGPTRVMSSKGGVAFAIVDGMRWLIDQFAASSARILYVSTSEVYGVPRVARENQDLNILYPYSGRREYSCGKLLGEIMLSNAFGDAAHPPLVVRPFNVAGPRQSDVGGFVLPRFAKAIIAGRPMTVYGSGAQRRCFTHVKDLVEAITALMRASATGTFNVGNISNNTSIGELAGRLAQVAARLGVAPSAKIDHVDPRALHGPDYEEAPDKIPDISRLKGAIDWQPAYDLDRLLEDVMRSFAGAGRVSVCA